MADNTIGVLFRITGDIAQSQRALRDLNLAFDGNFIAIDRLLKRFKTSTKETVDSSAKDFEKLAAKMKLSVPALEEVVRKFREAETDYKRFGAVLNSGAADAAKFIPDIEKLAAGLGGAGGAGGAGGGGVAGGAAAAAGGLAAMLGPLVIAAAVAAALAAAVGVVVKGLFDLATTVAKTDTQMEDLSERTGVSIRNLNALRVAAAESGKSFSTIENGLTRFVNNLAIGENGTTRFSRVMDQFGITSQGAFKNTNDALEQTIIKINSIESPANRAAAAFQVFGIRSDGFVTALSRLGTNLEEARKRAERFTGQVGPEQTAKSKSFEVSLNQLGLAAKGLGDAIGRALIPYIQPLIDLLTDVVIWTRKGLEIFGPFIEFLVNVAAPGTLPLLKNLDLLHAALASIPDIIKLVIGSFKDFADIARVTGSVFTNLGAVIAAGVSGNFIGAAAAFEALKASATELAAKVAVTTTGLAVQVRDIVAKHLNEILENRKKIQRELSGPDVDFAKKAKEQVDEEARARLNILNQRRQEAERIARAEVELAKQAFEQKEISLQDYENAVIRAENERLKVEKEIFAEEKKLIEESRFKGPEKARRNEEVAQAEREAERRVQEIKDRIETERRKREEDARKETAKRREQANEAADNAEIERLKALGEQRQITFEQMEQRIGEIVQDGFERRRKLLEAEKIAAGANVEERRKVVAQIEKLNEEESLSAEQRAKKIVEAQLKDLAAIRKLGDEHRKLKAQITSENLEIERLEAQQLGRNPFKQVEAAQARAQLERDLANERSRIRLEELETERAFEEGENEILGLELHNTASFNALIEAEKRRHAAELKNIDAEALHAARELDPGSGLSIFGEAGQQKLDETGSKFQGFAASVGAAFSQVTKSMGTTQSLFQSFFGSMAQGLGSLIQNFILTGKTGPAAFKQLAAGVIASLVAQAAVKAIFEVAEGIADLAKANAALASFNIPAAVQFQAAAAGHFAAAKVYGIIAGVGTAAAAALGAAGGGGGTGGSGGTSGGGNNNGQGERTIIQGDPRQNFAPQIIILRMEPGIIAEKVGQQYQQNGELRQIIRNDVLGG